jgi:hypothetical protein
MSQFYDLASLVVIPSGYKASTIYAQKPLTTDGQLSFTRASTATRVNASGLIETVASNVPRLDYTNSSCPRLLLEPQRTNLNLYSEQFDNAYWITQNVSLTANNTISPNGSLDADLINVSATSGEHNVYTFTPIVITANVDYTFSYFVKKGTGRYACAVIFYPGVGGGFGPYATYDLNTNTLVSSGAIVGNFTSSKLETFSNGWVRISVTGNGNFISAITAPDFRNAANLVPGTAFTGANETYSIWGAQVEAGAYATSYIPTTSASVTRVADECSKTGISSLFGSAFTLFVDVLKLEDNGATRYFVAKGSGGTYANFISIEKTGSGVLFVVTNSSSVTQVAIAGGSYAVGSRLKIAARCENGSYALYINGVQIGISSQAYTPSASAFDLHYFDYYGNNAINQAIILQPLTNAQLAELTAL